MKQLKASPVVSMPTSGGFFGFLKIYFYVLYSSAAPHIPMYRRMLATLALTL
jgi:hypothetical protein